MKTGAEIFRKTTDWMRQHPLWVVHFVFPLLLTGLVFGFVYEPGDHAYLFFSWIAGLFLLSQVVALVGMAGLPVLATMWNLFARAIERLGPYARRAYGLAAVLFGTGAMAWGVAWFVDGGWLLSVFVVGFGYSAFGWFKTWARVPSLPERADYRRAWRAVGICAGLLAFDLAVLAYATDTGGLVRHAGHEIAVVSELRTSLFADLSKSCFGYEGFRYGHCVHQRMVQERRYETVTSTGRILYFALEMQAAVRAKELASTADEKFQVVLDMLEMCDEQLKAFLPGEATRRPASYSDHRFEVYAREHTRETLVPRWNSAWEKVDRQFEAQKGALTAASVKRYLALSAERKRLRRALTAAN